MSLLRAVIERAVVLLVGSVYAFLVLCQTLFVCAKKGPKTVLTWRKRSKPPACLEDPSLGTHGYAHLEDVRMHYVSNGPEDKPLMLLVHGFPEFWYSWRHQLREFKDDYRVVAVDLRGYNETDKPFGIWKYSQAELCKDLKQFITAIGYSSCVLVGHDWGGALAWNFAEKYPELVDKLIILNCPNGQAFAKHLQKSFKQLKMSWYMFYFQIPLIPEFKFMTEDYAVLDSLFRGKKTGVKSDCMTADDVEAYKYCFSRNGLRGPINFYRAAFSFNSLMRQKEVIDSSKRHGITMPTLLIWGEDDTALEKPLAQLSCEICKNKHAIRYIPNCSHWTQMDRPDLVNKYMREFLNE